MVVGKCIKNIELANIYDATNEQSIDIENAIIREEKPIMFESVPTYPDIKLRKWCTNCNCTNMIVLKS